TFIPHGNRAAAYVINGKQIAKEVQVELKAEIDQWKEEGNIAPHLTAVLVGNDPGSKLYVKNKIKAAKSVGITSAVIEKPQETSQAELLDVVAMLNAEPSINGVLVQLPLPKHMNERTVCDAVHPDKDVDGFHMSNIGKLCLDVPNLIPATAFAVWELLKRSGIDTFGKNAVVCGRSKNIGMPVAALLHSDGDNGFKMGMDATVTTCHRYTPAKNLPEFTKNADIIIVAVGSPNLITADMVKEGATVIDVGINRIWDAKQERYRLVGDVDFEGVSKKASFITPVPGGVGPMTVAMLMKNTLQAAKIQTKKKREKTAIH
ncbi:putative bifunctional methylenetetrahydrofolate dehydrogenase/cyclohydrolase, mitochondrial-like, partial [Apostichopus japonicus]